MNILLFNDKDIVGQDDKHIHLKITGQKYEHIRHVQEFSNGDTLRIGLINGKQGLGKITSINLDSISITGSLDKESPTPARCKVIFAMPRPIMLKRILVDIAMLGIKEIVLLGSSHVQKSYWASKLFEHNGLEQCLLKGLEQVCDTQMPKVTLEKRFKPFVEDRLLGFSAFHNEESDIILAHPNADKICPQPARRPFTLIIGPENGFTPYEVSLLEENGATAYTVGERHLRVETAATYL